MQLSKLQTALFNDLKMVSRAKGLKLVPGESTGGYYADGLFFHWLFKCKELDNLFLFAYKTKGSKREFGGAVWSPGTGLESEPHTVFKSTKSWDTIVDAMKPLVEKFKRKGLSGLGQDEEFEPDEEDIYIPPNQREAWYTGKLIAEGDEWDELADNIKKWMEENKYWPNIWLQDDHGGLTLFRDW